MTYSLLDLVLTKQFHYQERYYENGQINSNEQTKLKAHNHYNQQKQLKHCNT